MATIREKVRQLIDQIDNARAAGSVTNRMLASVLNYFFGDKDVFEELDNKADKKDVYTKTETDTRLAGKADKTDVYTKTETDAKLASKADKNSVYTKTETDAKFANKADKKDVYTKTETDAKLANKADKKDVYTKTETDAKLANKADKKDVYTKTETDAKLANKAGTDVYRQIADVDADRRAAPFGKIISEQIDIEEESYGGDILEDQICYSTVLSTFVYKEFGTTKYYANWPTKKHYIGADGYPYLGKQFYCHDEDKMYVFDGAKLKAVQIPAVVAFSELWDADIDITMGSVADEREYPEYEVFFSTVHNRFVYKADDGKFYDNWSTRHLYIDQTNENNGPRSDVMYFALDLGNLYIYDFETSGTLKLINEDLTGFLNKNDHALTQFITAGREATVVDYTSIFENNLGEISKMHWMYFIHMQQKVVGIMDVQVSYAGNNGKIRITERLRTRALLSNDKKSIAWGMNMIWDENHEYTRFILSYNDMSQEIRAGEWTAWYEEPKITAAEKLKIANTYTKDEVDSRITNIERCTATADEDIDIVAGRTYVIWAQRTPSGGTMNFSKNVKAVTTVILKKAEGLIKMKVDGSTITRGIPTASGDYKLEFYTYGDGYMNLVWTKLEVFS